jgi:hypothetical protein
MQEDTGGKTCFPTSAAWQERKIKAKRLSGNKAFIREDLGHMLGMAKNGLA